MFESLIQDFNKIEKMYDDFNSHIGENPLNDLRRTPFTIQKRKDCVFLSGGQNGAVYYCSGGVTFYSSSVAAMVLVNHLFSETLTYFSSYSIDFDIPVDDIVRFISQNSDLEMDNHNFVFYYQHDLNCKTSNQHPFICDELNIYDNSNIDEVLPNLLKLSEISKIFHAFKLLIEPNSYFMTTVRNDLLNYKNNGSKKQYFYKLRYILTCIINSMSSFIDAASELASSSYSFEDDIPF